MHPAPSVILFTTLAGAGQGLFLALYLVEAAGLAGILPVQDGQRYFASGAGLTLAFLGGGLMASFFHLGRPARAWRAVVMWRTSWLSREVIVLAVFIALVCAYFAAHWTGVGGTAALGAVGSIVCLLLFVCTGMIYACLRFMQEWATPLTVVNYLLLGCASGFALAAAFSAMVGSTVTIPLSWAALVLTIVAGAMRVATLLRNAGLRFRSTLQTAVGINNPKLVQTSRGFTGSSFNTREFFHGRSRLVVRAVKWGFLALAFVLPVLLFLAALAGGGAVYLVLAVPVQFAGLLAERWYFFAEANHPQNLYYQALA